MSWLFATCFYGRSRCRCLVPQRCAWCAEFYDHCHYHLPNQIIMNHTYGNIVMLVILLAPCWSSWFTWWMMTIPRAHEMFIFSSLAISVTEVRRPGQSLCGPTVRQKMDFLHNGWMEFFGGVQLKRFSYTEMIWIVLKMKGHEIFFDFFRFEERFVSFIKIHRFFLQPSNLSMSATTGTLRWVTSEAC